MQIIQQYLADVQQIHSSGLAVKETSYYPALEKLFNGVGKTLKPGVFCVINISGGKSGIPDGGFFTVEEKKLLEKDEAPDAKSNFLNAKNPQRGVLEVKGDAQDMESLKDSAQVAKYLERYGLCLICNLRQFMLLECDKWGGKVVAIESFDLCDKSGQIFGVDAAQLAKARGEECLEFLRRCLVRGAPLNSPRDLAAWLASYARQARLQLASVPLESLAPLKLALEKALGITFQAADKPGKKLSDEEKAARGDHFFRATLVQTLFYGLFSAWLAYAREKPGQKLNWQTAQYSLHVPMIETLFSELVKVGNINALELTRSLELATDCLNRVEQAAFFEKWGQNDAVQYFYEPFLEAFDAQLRRDLGVYYTPPEIVKYMVERVHRALQNELDLPLGLADPSVYVLDPCCGTGAFVLETLRKIREVIAENPNADDARVRLKEAALKRVFGFEILPAPFVVAHHGVADLLREDNIELKSHERAPIYLTNALTGWDSIPQLDGLFPEFKTEVESAHHVKQVEKILVILGNPPYDAFAKIDEEGDLTGVYKKGLRDDWGVKKWNFGDLYLRFFRIAERKLEHSERGVLCYVSNFSYLREPSFVVMRQHLLKSFDSFWIDVLNGDSRETGKRTPDKLPDPSVFSTSFNKEGIKVGTAIGLMVRGENVEKNVLCRQFWGVAKREALLESLNETDYSNYERAFPAPENRFSLRPRDIGDDYAQWPMLTELCAESPSNGLMEKRGGALMALESETLETRMQAYFDASVSMEQLANYHRGLANEAAGYIPEIARKRLQTDDKYKVENILRYAIRPFDLRWCYYTGVNPLWNRARPTLRAQLWEGNSYLVSRPSCPSSPEGAPIWFVSTLGDNDALRGHAYYFPYFLRSEVTTDLEIGADGTMQSKSVMQVRANLSVRARAYLTSLGFSDFDDERAIGALIWQHALAMGYSPLYRASNAGGLSGDWPRVPLPDSAAKLRHSAALGARVAALLDSATPCDGIESGAFLKGLRHVGRFTRTDGAMIEAGDESLKVSRNWGFFGPRNIVQPGDGTLTARAATADENAAFIELGLGAQAEVFDVYASELGFWNGVPRRVWETLIGGYPVLKKWLSYRDERILGRALSLAEAREFADIIRRLTLICALENQLDENYEICADGFVVLLKSKI